MTLPEPDRFEITPNVVGRTIQHFCAQRLAAAPPRYLAVHPTRYTESRCCHEAVAAQIEREGGAARLGWLIREQPGMYLTADFHAVWENDDGIAVDVTPSRAGDSRSLFADDDGPFPVHDMKMRRSTHFLRTFRTKTYGDYALEAAGFEGIERNRHLPTDDDQAGVDDATTQGDPDCPLATAIDDFIMLSVCQNSMLVSTGDELTCKDPAAYDLVSRTRSKYRAEMMRLWGQNLIRKADAQFLFDGAV